MPKKTIPNEQVASVTLAPFAIISSDHNGRIFQFNEEAERLLGWTGAQAIGKNVRDIYAGGEKTARKVMKALRQTNNGKLHDHVTELLTADGRLIPISLSAVWHAQQESVTGYFRDLTEYRAALAAMFVVTAEVVSQVQETAVLQKIVDVLVETLGYQVAYFRLIDENGRLTIRAAAGTTGNYVNNPRYALAPGVGINGQVAMKGTAHVIHDVTQSPEFYFTDMQERDGLRGMLSVPVKSQGQVIGVLACYRALPYTATEPDIQMVTSLANIAATTLKKAQLFSQERQHKEQLRILFKTGLMLTNSLKLEQTFQILADTACKLVGASGAYICLVEGDQLIPATGQWQHPYHERPKTQPRPDGLNYTVARKERALFIKSVNDHPLYHDWQWGGAIAGLPLIYDQKLLGVLTVAFAKPHTFDKYEKRILRLLSYQAANTINKAHLVDRLRQEQDLITEVSRTMDKMADLQATLEVILDGAIRLTGAERGNLALLDTTQNMLINEVQSGFPPGYFVRNHQVGDKSIQGQVAALRRAALINNVRTDLYWSKHYYAGGEIDTVSELTVPILNQATNELVGVINLEDSRENAFNENDLQLVLDLAVHACVALGNARLFAQTKRQTDDQKKLIQIGKAVSRDLRMDEVVDTLHDQLQEHFGTDIIPVVLLHLEDENILRIIPSSQIDLSDRVPDLSWQSTVQLTQGITGWVARNRKPALVPDVNADERYLRILTTTRSEIAVPILHGDKLVGVLDIESPHLARFDNEDLRFLQLVANQVAAAIEHARHYEILDTRQKQLQALHRSSKAIADAGITLHAVLQAILNQAVAVTGAHFGSLQLLDNKQNHLVFEAAWPEEDLEMLRNKFGFLPVDQEGITARAIRENQAQLVADVSLDGDYISARETTRSELAVVLRQGRHQPIGVLNVERKQVDGFSEADRDLLINLSYLAVAAINNAKQANQLSRINEVAIMGAWGADFFHDMMGEVSGIRRKVYRLREYFDLPDDVNAILNTIDQHAEQLNVPFPVQPPKPGEADGRGYCVLDMAIEAVVDSFRSTHVTYTFEPVLTCADVAVAIHVHWLRRALVHLINNSLRAIPDSKSERRIKITTHRQDNIALVYVEDTGLGVEPNVEVILFEQPINAQSQHQGRGLLLVRFMVEQYGGSVELDWTELGKGTRFLVKLPVHQRNGSSAQDELKGEL